MKTLLIPVDFTNTSDKAVNFGCEWAKKYSYERIILLRSFYSSMYENMIMSADFSSVNEEYLNKKRDDEKALLNQLCKETDEKTGEEIMVQTAVSELPLVRSIIELIKNEKPEMILLGSDTASCRKRSLCCRKRNSHSKIKPREGADRSRKLSIPAGRKSAGSC